MSPWVAGPFNAFPGVLALQWAFGPEHGWRTLRARVVHRLSQVAWGWVVGCVLEEPLPNVEVEALLAHAEPVAHVERFGPTW